MFVSIPLIQSKKIVTNGFSVYLQEELENTWASIAEQITSALTNEITLPEEEHPLPFDAVSEKSLEEQK